MAIEFSLFIWSKIHQFKMSAVEEAELIPTSTIPSLFTDSKFTNRDEV